MFELLQGKLRGCFRLSSLNAVMTEITVWHIRKSISDSEYKALYEYYQKRKDELSEEA